MTLDLLVIGLQISILCCSVAVASGLEPEIVEFTDSINVIVGSPVEYSCTGVGDDILYFVNNSVASNFVSSGFYEQIGQDSLGNGLKRRNLTLESATIDLNNTKVVCRVTVLDIPNPPTHVFSNASILRIQGPLAAVNIYIDAIVHSSTSLNVTWSAPYTLDGVDILGYNITITNTSNDNILHTHFTQDTQYVISNNDGDPCTELTLTISGYNGAGDGGATSANFTYPQAFSLSHTLNTLEATFINKSAVDLALNLSVIPLCPNQYPDDITGIVHITDYSGTNYYYNVTTSDRSRVINNNFIIQTHTIYGVNVVLSKNDGNFEIISNNISAIKAIASTSTSTVVMTSTTTSTSYSITTTNGPGTTTAAAVPSTTATTNTVSVIDSLSIIVALVGVLVSSLVVICILIGILVLYKQCTKSKEGENIRKQAIMSHQYDYERNPSYSSLLSSRPSITHLPQLPPNRPLPEAPVSATSPIAEVRPDADEYDYIKIYMEVTDEESTKEYI